ncbi:hypothetical protein GE21DRAFT_4103 [Neurospora crassa]|uniref:Uncharacterized protein n=1 Tax=Neurospora crassa (strain ATCC 24698 / 74-OR23-1A / CBS 708.71 / DSM 1257 / FGSC 987) TaxID=367110 RepID=Q7RYU4_NEUCR|nr:hypothetical protein NCU06476 [Neurospora crassa OR74A]EAA28131.1 hypothetical protein NCU06476 [Neurospora crassa OR74A]KHE85474.1 hypothetical protein GE21DRAFT_4103 [Neurospora crassa]|eukprot:XP_957367.1 hypothetical protein NCU06476 [Neurospora crassa OR74A]
MPCPVFDVIACIQSSRLLTHYTHHVSLQWQPCLCSRDSEGRRTNNYQHWDWLLKLEQLKTLELVLFEGWIRVMACIRSDSPRSNPGGNAQAIFCSICLSKLMTLRNLEKVVFKVDFDIYTPTAAEIQRLERSRWFARIKKQVSDMILKAPTQVKWTLADQTLVCRYIQEEAQPRYLIEQHLGAVDTEWPRSSKI